MKKLITLLFLLNIGNLYSQTNGVATNQSQWQGLVNNWLVQGGKDPRTLASLMSKIPIGASSNNAWGLTGNISTNPAANFIGTTDNEDLLLKRNSIPFAYLTTRMGPGNPNVFLIKDTLNHSFFNVTWDNSGGGNNGGAATLGSSISGADFTVHPFAKAITADDSVLYNNGNFENAGSVKIVDGTQGAGYVLTSDASGNASWQDLSGTYLPLAGGTMNGGSHIYFGTGGQNISQGSFNNGTGGNNGISLNCAIGYELNWQGGHLSNNSSGSFYPVLIDSGITVNGQSSIISDNWYNIKTYVEVDTSEYPYNGTGMVTIGAYTSNYPIYGKISGASLNVDTNGVDIGYGLEMDYGSILNHYQYTLPKYAPELGQIIIARGDSTTYFGINTPALDSITIYALTPIIGQTYFCTDCTGNPYVATWATLIGGLITWTGSLWRRNF